MNISKMATWVGRSKGLPTISVCHMINISDRIAILFFISSLIRFDPNYTSGGQNATTYSAAVKMSKMKWNENEMKCFVYYSVTLPNRRTATMGLWHTFIHIHIYIYVCNSGNAGKLWAVNSLVFGSACKK